MSIKKKGRWKTLDINDPEPEPIKIEFSCFVEYNGRTFKAGGTHLDILGQRNVPYVGMMILKDGKVVNKLIEMDEIAYQFFVDNGLPVMIAKAFVTLAVAVRDESK